MEKLRVHLIGRPFVVITDCSALRSTFAKKHMVPGVTRWWLNSLEFTFEVRHRPSTQMNHLDALSRNPGEGPKETDCGEDLYMLTNSLEDDWLSILHKRDTKIKGIMYLIRKKKRQTKNV
ncbi:hypothetical protein Trydic_g21621 [Trypoxylus dichotomus]